MRTPWFLIASLLLACSVEINASDYDQSCNAATDCMPIFVGKFCECSCTYAAINLKDAARYNKDISVTCDKHCAPCPEAVVTCEQNRCIARKK